jgi:hypothetical protein
MMYSFAARGDCHVVDEPFYASYLSFTGLDHPMREEIIASQSTDPMAVIETLTDDIPGGLAHAYHKHMTQHMTCAVPRDWVSGFKNVFLIRHPARVIASYAAKRENPTLDDIGFRQQAELFDLAATIEERPVVIDSFDIRADPKRALSALCAAIELPFSEDMLKWPAGGHAADGVWAKHWYAAVWESTGFGSAEGPLPEVPDSLKPVLEEALPYYQKLKEYRVYSC